MWVTSVIPGRSKFQKTRNLKRNDYDHHQKSGWVYSSHDQDAKFKFDRGWTTTITKIWTGHLGGQVKFQKTGFSKLLWLHSPSKMKGSEKRKMTCSKNGKSRSQKCGWLLSEKKGDDGNRHTLLLERKEPERNSQLSLAVDYNPYHLSSGESEFQKSPYSFENDNDENVSVFVAS